MELVWILNFIAVCAAVVGGVITGLLRYESSRSLAAFFIAVLGGAGLFALQFARIAVLSLKTVWVPPYEYIDLIIAELYSLPVSGIIAGSFSVLGFLLSSGLKDSQNVTVQKLIRIQSRTRLELQKAD